MKNRHRAIVNVESIDILGPEERATLAEVNGAPADEFCCMCTFDIIIKKHHCTVVQPVYGPNSALKMMLGHGHSIEEFARICAKEYATNMEDSLNAHGCVNRR